MSPRTLRLVIVVALALIAVWYLTTRHGGIEGRVRKQVDQVRKLVAKAPGEGDLESMNRARRISELFAAEFEFAAPQFDFTTRDRRALVGAIHRYRSRSQVIAMRVRELDIAPDESARRATVHLVADFITGADDLMGREAYVFQINCKEAEDGEWRIDYVRLLEILERG